MPKPNKRSALDALVKRRLTQLAHRFELDVRKSHPKQEFIDALARSKKASFAAILGVLNLDELRDICRAHDLDDSAKDRATLEARILGTAAKPKSKPGKSKKAAKSKQAKQATSKSEQLGLELPPDPNKSPAKRARRTMAIKKGSPDVLVGRRRT